MGYLEMRPEESYSMSARLPYWTLAPEAVKRMMAINSYLVGSGIEPACGIWFGFAYHRSTAAHIVLIFTHTRRYAMAKAFND